MRDTFSQVHTAGMGGVVGIGLEAALTYAKARNFDLEQIAELLPSAEAGMLTAFNESGKENA